MVVQSAFGDAPQGQQHGIARCVVVRGHGVPQQRIENRGLRELRRITKAAVDLVEGWHQGVTQAACGPRRSRLQRIGAIARTGLGAVVRAGTVSALARA